MIVNVTYREEFVVAVEVSSLDDAQAEAEKKAKWRTINELHSSFIQLVDEEGYEIKCPNCGGQKIVDGEDNPLKCLDCKYTW